MNTPPVIFVMLGLLLASCAPTIMAAGPVDEEPTLSSQTVRMNDGAMLPLKTWLPDGETHAVIVALHGFNDYANAFDAPGKFLAARGIAVYAYDQRGFGGAPNRGYWAGEEAMTADLVAVARLVAARHPGKPLFLMGESMGGAVVMATMVRPDAPPVAGIILSAPAVWGRDSMSLVQRGALWLASYTLPWLTLTGKGLDIRPSDNIEMLRALGADPLVIKETRVDAIHGLCDLMDHATRLAPDLRVPVLALYGDHDEVVPPEPSLRMMEDLPDADGRTKRALYANGYHMLLRDLEAKTVWTDIDAWIAAPRAPLPSGADGMAEARLASLHATEK